MIMRLTSLFLILHALFGKNDHFIKFHLISKTKLYEDLFTMKNGEIYVSVTF